MSRIRARSDHVGYLLMSLGHRIRTMTAERTEPLGCSPRQFGVLQEICRIGPVSQANLGRLLSIDRTTMVEVIDQLEQMGLVERRSDSADRRANLINASTRGEKLREKLAALAEEAEESFLVPLARAERQQFMDFLARLAKHHSH